MPIADEKVEEILTAFKDMMLEMKRVQAENSELHKAMISLLKEKIAAPPSSPTADGSNVSYSESSQPLKTQSTNRPKPTRPIINEEVDDLEWIIFQDSWNRYKTMTGLVDEATICLELREACSADVNRPLYDYVGAGMLNKSG